jgi:hypothetical protein
MRDFLNSPVGMAVWALGAMLPFWLMLQWVVQQQVWAMERQIWDESLSDEAREEQRQARERAAKVRHEARRRLGLPEEDPQ